jgi:hypothetical protein
MTVIFNNPRIPVCCTFRSMAHSHTRNQPSVKYNGESVGYQQAGRISYSHLLPNRAHASLPLQGTVRCQSSPKLVCWALKVVKVGRYNDLRIQHNETIL